MVAEKSLITDEMKKAIGVRSQPVTYEIERGLIRQFAEAIEDANPLWRDEAQARKTPFGGVVALPTFLRSCIARELEEVKYPVERGLDAGSEWEYFLPVRPGDTITVEQRITDFTEKKGRLGPMLFETIETAYVNQFGELVATQTSRGIYY